MPDTICQTHLEEVTIKAEPSDKSHQDEMSVMKISTKLKNAIATITDAVCSCLALEKVPVLDPLNYLKQPMLSWTTQ